MIVLRRSYQTIWIYFCLVCATGACAENAIENAAQVSSTDTPAAGAPAPVLTEAMLEPVEEMMETGAQILISWNDVLGPGPAEYGFNGWWTDQEGDLWRQRSSELSPALVRIPAVQGMLEPTNDDDDPFHTNWDAFLFDKPVPWLERTITLRYWLEAVRDSGAAVMLHVPYLSGWLSANGNQGVYSTYPPNNLDEYREYLQALLTFTVSEVGFPPDRVILEPVNEPDLECGQDPDVPCFWDGWEMDDLAAVLRAAKEAAGRVSPEIRVVGVAECCGTQLVETLMGQYDGENLLDGVSYHYYQTDMKFGDLLARGEDLMRFGKPVYLDEYGSTRYWSNGDAGALWHALLLPAVWQAGLRPVQYPLAEFEGSHEAYQQLGLFADWRGSWKIKPAYYVYANFYRYFGGRERLSVEHQLPLVVMAVRSNSDQPDELAIWLVNPGETALEEVRIEVVDYPVGPVQVEILDNFVGGEPRQVLTDLNHPISFSLDFPMHHSYTIRMRTQP